MKLTRVTISGVDDKTDRKKLRALSAEYPFVEWGILVSAKRQGSARYPSPEVIIAILASMPASRLAMHFCGEAAREVLSGDGPSHLDAVRYQINGFSSWVKKSQPLTPFGQWISSVRAGGNSQVILQLSSERAMTAAILLAGLHPNVSALWDESGGKGVELSEWPDPPEELRLGYAGGITPESVAAVAKRLTEDPNPQETWIDMESGVRTDDELDLDKVRSVLEQAKEFIG